MLGSIRSGATAGVAVLVGIAGLSCVLAGAAEPTADWRPRSNSPPTASSRSPSAIANGSTSARR